MDYTTKNGENARQIADFMRLILAPGQTTELRALNVSAPNYRAPHTVSGYFDDIEKLAVAACSIRSASGIYFVPNPIEPALLARAANRARPVGKEPTTSDRDITGRRWVLIDVDPVRPAGISATNEEHELALACVRVIRDALTADGWHSPILADSGNGAHLLYRIELPAQDSGLVKRCLEALAFRFDDERVKIDTTVHNPARIWKLYGTVSRKGDSTPDRPHRLSRILEAPDTPLAPVPTELLEALAGSLPKEPEQPQARSGASNSGKRPFDLDAWLIEHNLDVRGPSPWQSGRRWIFNVCPWNPDHTNGSAYIVQFASGAIAAGCHHNGCSGRDWHSLRDLVEPGWSDHRTSRTGHDPGSQGEPAARSGENAAHANEPDSSTRIEPVFSGADGFHLTDLGNSERLLSQYGRDIRYCYPWGSWLTWTGTHWKRDDTGELFRMTDRTIRQMYRAVADVEDIEQRARIIAHATTSEKRDRRIAAIAGAQCYAPILPAEMDRDPWLLNCQNGTINLKTGELQPHRRADNITKLAPVAYDPDATCPTWNRFLERIMAGKRALIDFLQRAVGYSLTGSVREQVLFFLYGSGKNGKSTFLHATLDMIGDYGQQAPPELLIAKKSDRHPTEQARLFGTRFVPTIEVEQGREMAEVLTKQLTGGDRIAARFMRQDFFEFEATFKLWLAANHKPTVRGTDDAIWRRIKLIPFSVRIPDAECDPDLPEKLKAELPGILAWAVRGCLAWQREGLNFPAEVNRASEEYRAEQDVLAAFLSECCIQRPTGIASVKTLYEAYTMWCEKGGERALTKRQVSARLTERGFFTERVGKDRVWHWIGLGLLADVADIADVENSINATRGIHEAFIPKITSATSATSAADDDDGWKDA